MDPNQERVAGQWLAMQSFMHGITKEKRPNRAFLHIGLSTQDQPPQELGRNIAGTAVTAVPPSRAAELPQTHSDRGAAAVMAALPADVGTKLTVLSAGPQGRGDPARGTHHGGGGRDRGDVLAPSVPRGAGNRGRALRD